MLFQGPVRQGTSQALLPLRPTAGRTSEPSHMLIPGPGTMPVIRLPPDPWPGMEMLLWAPPAPRPCPIPILGPLDWSSLLICLSPQGSAPWGVGFRSELSYQGQRHLPAPGPSSHCPTSPTYNLPVYPQSSHPRPPPCPKPGSMARFCLYASCLLNNSVCHTVTPSPVPLAWAG